MAKVMAWVTDGSILNIETILKSLILDIIMENKSWPINIFSVTIIGSSGYLPKSLANTESDSVSQLFKFDPAQKL